MPKYYIWTIGCQMNKAESLRLSAQLDGSGYQAADNISEADLVVVNSCVVRQSAENRVVNKLKNLRPLKKMYPGKVLALTGCMVDSDEKGLRADFPYVDHFFKPGVFPTWLETSKLPLSGRQPVSVYVPIIQGCNNFCTYCIVPYRRGREKSRPVYEIDCEVRGLVSRGVKEVVLLGQNVDSYGHDLSDKPELADLLSELNKVDGLERIRFLTNHPKDMSLRLIKSIASLEKVCEDINLPVQSGNNDILKSMKRGYTVEDYGRLVRLIRDNVPGVGLSTDIIVGFPSESEAQFQETFNLLDELKFDTVHVAAYSPRPGTAAARELEDDVPSPAKKERLNRVEQLQEKIASEINERLLGKEVEVLVEENVRGKWQGRTRSGKLVFFRDKNDRLEQLVNIKIGKTSAWSLQGEMVE